VAITGKTITPPLLESMVIAGRQTSLARLEKALLLLEGGERSRRRAARALMLSTAVRLVATAGLPELQALRKPNLTWK